MSFPKVAVQILLYVTPPEEFDRLMGSLETVNYPKDCWKIVLVKNFSEAARTPSEYVREKWLVKAGQTLPEIIFYEQTPNLGFAGGHVKAEELSHDWRPDYLYLLNDDTWVAPDFLLRVVTLAEEKKNAALVQSLVMLDDGERVNSIGNAMHFLGFGFALGHRQLLGEIKNDLPVFYTSGAGLLVRTSVLEKIGGLFDPLFIAYHEDLDLSWRARLAGFDILLASESKIFHHYEFSKSIKKYYLMERNRHLTNFVNYKWPTLLLLVPAALIMESGTFLFSFRSGWWREKIRSWLYLFRPATWLWIYRRRALVKSFRLKTDRAMLPLMTGSVINQEVENPLLKFVANPFMEAYLWLLKKVVFW
ncbi:MAG: glycosyltransferase family 2 protein [Patescibacteria group bacterium]|jgi:GT2 family glycosyltransferase